MTEKIDKLMEYLQFPAVRYAIIVGLLISLCSSLLGVTLVMKRFSFIGDGLSHVAFGAMAIATVLNVTDNMLIIMPVTVVSAVLLLRTGQNTRIKGDAAVAMISVGALALGYLLMNLAPKNGRTSANLSADVCSTLFGSTSILTLSQKDVITCVVMSAIVVAVFFFFYTKIFAVTFDESFAKATGIRSDLYNLLIAVVIAVIIVFAMNFVGSLLISALIIFPALSAMRVFKSFRSVIVCSVIISLFCASMGLLLAILEGTPVGSTIVAADIAVFFIFSIISMVARRGEK
ncbi:MAG: metal ABC transporter permease [Ruminococcus sp.]|nr:metal ABC transporter permease [Ruminococcus sp.]